MNKKQLISAITILFTFATMFCLAGCQQPAPSDDTVNAYIQDNYPGLIYQIEDSGGTGEMDIPYTAVKANNKECRIYMEDDIIKENVYSAVYGDRYDQQIRNILQSVGIEAIVQSEFNEFVTTPVTEFNTMQRIYKSTDIFIQEPEDYELLQEVLSDYVGHYEVFISDEPVRKGNDIAFSFDIENY